jgi:FKBP-type peptidyl-prolyl cis-trans isomerase
LCYKSTTEFLCTSTIYPEYSFKVQNNYAYFYDDKQRYYSVLFKTNQEAIKFTCHVTIARFKVSDGKNVISNDIVDGTGKGSIQNSHKVQVLYTGWLLQSDPGSLPKLGKMFDSNVQTNKPLNFTVGEHTVIKGWEEGVLDMKTGGKRFVVIPNHLAYGEEGRNPVIPPYSTLCFQIEVLKFKSTRKNSSAKEDLLPNVSLESPTSVNQQEHSQNSILNRIMKHGTPTVFNVVDPQVQVESPVSTNEQPLSIHQLQQKMEQNTIQQNNSFNQQGQQMNNNSFSQQGQQMNGQGQNNSSFSQQNNSNQGQGQNNSFGQGQNNSFSQVQENNNSNTTIDLLQKQIQSLTEMMKKNETPKKEEEKEEKPIVKIEPKTKEINELMSKMNEISDKLDNMDLTSLMKTNDREKKERLMSAPILLQNVQFLVETNESLRKEISDERQTIDNLNEKILFLRKRALEKLEHTTDEFLQKDLENAKERIIKLNQRILELQVNNKISI